jgi:motility/secretion related protein SprA
MSLALTLPLVGLLIGLPGIPGLSKKLPKLRLPHKAVVDTLPPVWKPYSLLVLEDQFVFARLMPIGPKSTAFKVNNDPRRLEINVDPDSGTVSAVTAMGEVPVAGAARVPFAQYNRDLAWQSFSKAWTERSRQSVNTRSGPAVPLQRGGRQFALPVTLPKAYTSILGPGGPAINVSGSENIKLAGTSEWSNQQSYTGQRRSLFPSLDMEQDLDIRLEGQLSDRVKVNLLQNSATQIPLANKIAINYKGDEDDLVQSLDLGNTNLSLPGTQYVSYSGRNEGLFGMKATTRLGPLDFTMLASKQEGKSERASYAGGASRGTQTLNDYDYVRGVYFLLYDPNFETQDIDQSSIRLYLDDGTNYASRVNAIRGRAFVDPRTARLDSIGTQPGEYTPSARGFFSLLTQGAENDYEIMNDVYGPLYRVIRLKRAIEGDEPRLAVTYAYRSVVNGQPVGDFQPIGGADTLDTDGATSRTMKLLRAPLDLLVARPDGYFRSDTLMAATLELELRNFYNLNGQRIDPKSFTLAIRHGVDNPPVTYVSQANGEPVPYNEILGLDNFDESNGTPVYRKHDAKVDGTLPSSTSRLFVDYENGVLFFFDPRPFAPRIADDPTQVYPPQPFDRFLSRILFRRDSLVGAPDAPNERNRAIYDLRSSRRAADPIRPQVSRYYLDIEFTAARAGNEINLGRSNIIEGSEAVTINGRRLERDKDYTVDYDLGRVSLKAPPGAADQVSVDYSYAPLFQQAGRTLLGSAFRLEGRERHVGGAFLFESKGAQDLRPRLGEEPSRVLIGDLNAEWRTRPGFMTRWVDALPGVRTTAPSEFNVSAEMGASFPNPNTFNEVYVDDMEGVRDAVSLIMTPERWRWASMPSRKNTITGFADSIQSFQKNAEVHWFTPLNAVKERDLKPNLTDAQGAQNPRQTLAISVPQRPPAPWSAPGDSLWAGLTYLLDGRGLDLSRAQFIELWVNDFRDENKVPRTRGRVRLHIDLGRVSEDQRRSPAGPANRALDTEDLFPRDKKLDVTDVRNEDTGLDGVNDAGESATHEPAQEVADPSLITSGPNDPAGDDYRQPDVSNGDPRLNLDPYRWLYINGTEANKNVYPVPDTEDLNGDDNLALVEPNRGGDYFEYTIDLASSPYLADSVYAPGRTYANNGDPIPSDNGWRRYRIPISDSLRVQFGAPELLAVRHVRVWVEGITNADDVVNPAIGERRPLLLLGGLEIVGSRWLVTELTPGQNSSGTTVTLNSINNVDNADVYVPPFDPGSTRNGAQDLTRREQSLALEFTRLLPGDSLEAFKTFSLDENYSRYGTLRFYVAGFDLPGYDPAADSLSYFVRFASDERGINYYEYRAPVPRSSAPGGIDWSEVRLKLTELSNLKLDPQAVGRDTIIAPGSSPGVTLIVKGRPSFTRLRRISFGLVNRGPKVFPSGSVWLDELRATDVARDRGQAQRFGVTGRMSNLLNYTFNYNARDEDFLSVGETRGGGNRTNGYTATAGLELHRFFAGTGIVLPITLNLSGNRAQPRYTAGDDVLRTGALATASESRVNSRSYGVSYGRTWSERSNPLLRYTVGGISATLSQTRSENISPSSVDTSRSTGATVNYSISPRRLLAVPLPGTKAKLWPLPERVFWNYSVGTTSSRTYDRLRDASGTLVLRNDSKGRTASIDFGADSRPFDILHHQFQARRNLTLPDRQLERIGFINLGRVVQWNQSMDSRYALNRGAWLRPQLNWSASYYQNNGPELSPSLGVKAISNSGVVSVAWTLPFDQLVSSARAAQPDTLHRGPAAWQSGLSHLGAVSLDASVNRGSQYTRLSGIPSFPYFVGFSNDPGLSDGRMGAQFGNTSTQSQDFRTSGRTRLLLARGASVRTSAEFNTRRGNTNGLVNRSRRVQFPNLDVDYGKLPEAIGLKRLLVNPSLRTTYIRNRTTDFSNSPTPTSISTSSEWRPLLRITGDLKNGTRAELGIQHRATESVYRQVGSSVTSEANTDVDLSLNRAYTKGQKVSFMGKTSAVKSNITLGFTAAYSRRKGETRQAGIDRPFNPVNEDRLNVNARGSYGFSTNVTGNAELGYSQNRYLQQGNVRRSIRVELRAQFTF